MNAIDLTQFEEMQDALYEEGAVKESLKSHRYDHSKENREDKKRRDARKKSRGKLFY